MTPIAFLRRCLGAGLSVEHALIAAEAYEQHLIEVRGALIVDLQGRLEGDGSYVRLLPSDWLEIRARIFTRDGKVCRYCDDTGGPFHIDHIEPLRWGGSHDDDNLCVACAPCNLSKKDSSVAEWRARQ